MTATPISLRFDGSVAVLTLDDGRGNALNRTAFTALDEALDAAALKAGALVIRGREKVFCGGLDLPQLDGITREDLESFLVLFNRVHDRLLSFPVPIVTAARGSAVAGGGILLAAGDARLVTPAGKAGVNEVALGLNIPTSALEVLRVALGERGVAEAVQTGRLYEGDERLRVGFATEVVEPERIDERAMEIARGFAAHDREALASLRTQLRRASLERVAAYSAGDTARFRDLWFAEGTQRKIRAVIERLRAR